MIPPIPIKKIASARSVLGIVNEILLLACNVLYNTSQYEKEDETKNKRNN